MNICNSFGKRLSGRFKLHEAVEQGEQAGVPPDNICILGIFTSRGLLHLFMHRLVNPQLPKQLATSHPGCMSWQLDASAGCICCLTPSAAQKFWESIYPGITKISADNTTRHAPQQLAKNILF